MSIKVKSTNDDRSGSRVANIGQPMTAVGGSSTNSTNSTNCTNSTNSSSVRPGPKVARK